MARYDKNRAPRRVQKKQEAKSEQQQSEDHHSSDERKQEGIQPTESIDETSEVIQHDSMPTIIHWIPGSVIQIPESAGQQFNIQINQEEHTLEVRIRCLIIT